MLDTLINHGTAVTDKWLDEHLKFCTEKIRSMLPKYSKKFPSACTTDMQYRLKNNDDWTNGFWTAMLWQSYEITNDEIFKLAAKENLNSFKQRLKNNIVLAHHDIGFLYSLSAYAGYTITENIEYKNLVIDAADKLISRFQKKGNFIQAWGDLNDNHEYRLIIDSLLNLPLLFEATRLSNNIHYGEIAKKHYKSVIKNIIRLDYSTFHTFYFDKLTGNPLRGATHQGFSNSSCWARGQAWLLLGIPLYNYFTDDFEEKEIYKLAFNYYVDRLPSDGVPYWDLIFIDNDLEPKDSSAAAITACGLIQAEKQAFISNGIDIAKGIVFELSKNYETNFQQEGLLQHGVYAYASNKGVDEANLWGDYFYFEALMRLKFPDWKTYW